jgi:hypothetical protein
MKRVGAIWGNGAPGVPADQRQFRLQHASLTRRCSKLLTINTLKHHSSSAQRRPLKRKRPPAEAVLLIRGFGNHFATLDRMRDGWAMTQFTRQPAGCLRIKWVGCHHSNLGLIALETFEQSPLKSDWSRRNAFKDHAPLATRTSRTFDGGQVLEVSHNASLIGRERYRTLSHR